MNYKKLTGSVNLGKYIDKPTLDEVKNYLRVEHNYDDKIISDLIESSYNLTTVLEHIEKRYYKGSSNKPLKDQSYHQKRIADSLEKIAVIMDGELSYSAFKELSKCKFKLAEAIEEGEFYHYIDDDGKKVYYKY